MSTSPIAPAASAAPAPKRADNMPLIFQEAFTVIVRLRANRQRVNDPEVFRSQVRNALKAAESEGTRRGYTIEDMRVATFAVVAFLDESILNSMNPIFADWQRKPLQEEMFGVHIAGEIFFRNLDRLLARPDSEALADLLELHQLCLLLGFRGRYSASSSSAEIRSLIGQIEEKIRRIRGAGQTLPWQPPSDTIAHAPDKWTPLLKWSAVVIACLAILLFVFYKFSLSSAASELMTLAAGAGR